jgi:hypothetical protein
LGRLTNIKPQLGSIGPRLKPPLKLVEQFYSSPEWLALRAKRKRDPDYQAALQRAKPGERVILDHIRERRDGGDDLDPNNTAWLTNSEHQAKTARERSRRARGQT